MSNIFRLFLNYPLNQIIKLYFKKIKYLMALYGLKWLKIEFKIGLLLQLIRKEPNSKQNRSKGLGSKCRLAFG